jgi:hypothetical protein
MSRASVSIAKLPAHLQQKARGLAGVDLGPESPLHSMKGRGRKRRDPGEEHDEQVALFAWADDPVVQETWPELDALYAIPNESFGIRDGAEKKARGRRKGMLDVCLPVARRAPDGSVYGSCYIEMKALTGSVRESQQERIRILRARGNFVDVAMSANAGKALLIMYLGFPKP